MVSTVNSMNSENPQAKAKSPKRLSRFSFWLLIISMGMVFVPLYLVNVTIEEATTLLIDDLSSLQASLAIVPEVDAEEVRLRETLTLLESEAQSLDSLSLGLEETHINWAVVTTTIGNYEPTLISITGLTQENQQLTLTGVAHSEAAITDYAMTLRDSQMFQQVAIQLIALETTAATEEQAAFTVARFTLIITINVGAP